MIFSFLITLVLPVLRLLVSQDYVNQRIQDELSYRQLREVLIQSEVLDVKFNQLDFIYQGKQMSCHQSGQWLLIEPGTWIFFDQVKEVSFYKDGQKVMMNLTTKTQSWQKELAVDE